MPTKVVQYTGHVSPACVSHHKVVIRCKPINGGLSFFLLLIVECCQVDLAVDHPSVIRIRRDKAEPDDTENEYGPSNNPEDQGSRLEDSYNVHNSCMFGLVGTFFY